MAYKFIPALSVDMSALEIGTLGTVLHQDEWVNITVFGIAKGQEISTHTVPTPAVLYFVRGEATVKLGEDTVQARAGSLVYMHPLLRHAIVAIEETTMLLIQFKIPKK